MATEEKAFQTAEERLPKASRQARIALAAACAQRVAPVYDKYYVGNHYPEVVEAIEFAWEYVLTNRLNRDRLASLLEELNEVTDFLAEEEITILSESASVSLFLIEALADDEAESLSACDRVIGSSLYVAQLAGSCSDGDEGERKADQEENDWQEKALSLIETWQQPCHRKMFDSCGPTPPQWWFAYEAAPEHY
jgi:hypothetical protein